MIKKLLFLALAALPFSASAEYSFDVQNNTDSAIVALEVSEDGKKWGKFNIGKGIRSGATSKLVWDSSTDDSGCEWYFKAKFNDGTESEVTSFDFCEEDLVLEFN